MINKAHLSLNVGIELHEINLLTHEIFRIAFIFPLIIVIN